MPHVPKYDDPAEGADDALLTSPEHDDNEHVHRDDPDERAHSQNPPENHYDPGPEPGGGDESGHS